MVSLAVFPKCLFPPGKCWFAILHVYKLLPVYFSTGSHLLFWFNFQLTDGNMCVLITPSCKADDGPLAWPWAGSCPTRDWAVRTEDNRGQHHTNIGFVLL